MRRSSSGRPRPRSRQKPEKTSLKIQKGESAEEVSGRVYQKVRRGRNIAGQKTTGGLSLLKSCNHDVNRLSGWDPEKPDFDVHNAASLHFTRSTRKGSLPEAVESGRVILQEAWIEGEYRRASFPGEPPEPEPPKEKPTIRQSRSEHDSTQETHEFESWRRMVWPEHNLPNAERPAKKGRNERKK